MMTFTPFERVLAGPGPRTPTMPGHFSRAVGQSESGQI